MKKFKMMIIAAILTFFVTLNVSALEITTNSSKSGTTDTTSKYVTNKGDLKVTNVKSTTDAFAAYKVLDTYYSADNNVLTYEFTNDFKSFMTDEGISMTVDEYAELTGLNDGQVKSNGTLDTLVSKYAKWIKEGNSATSVNLTTSGTTAQVNTEAGAYLILPTSTMNVYSVMVGNVKIESENNEWTLVADEIKAKASDPGTVTKAVVDSSGASVESTSYNIGEDYKYDYIISATAPTYPTNAINRKYTIVDTLDNGITFSQMKEIKDGATTFTLDNGNIKSGTDVIGTYSVSGQTITIDFTDIGKVSGTINIKYEAYLNNNAELGDTTGNINTVSLTYSNDPYGTGTSDADDSTVPVYTYGLEVTKVDEDDTTKKLPNAVFEIYQDAGLTTKIGEITTNESGLAKYAGLAEGTYYLKEIKAPNGYVLLSEAVAVKVKTTGAIEGTESGYYAIQVRNPQSVKLPFTGGAGTIIFTIVGLLLIIVASVLFVIYNKKQNN